MSTTTWEITPRPYQREAIDAVHDAVRNGLRRVLIALPTGTGKTVVFVSLIRERGGRALILVHRDELIWQAVDKIRIVIPGADVGIVKAERDEHDREIVVASVQTLARENRLRRLSPTFSTIVIDEAHHAAAPSYRKILDYLGAFSEDGPIVVGVTATPERGDGVGLHCVFQEIVYEKRIPDMIMAGYLCDVRAVRVGIAADFSDLRVQNGDFVDRELEQKLLDADAPDEIAEAYDRFARDRKAIVFTPTVRTAQAVEQALRERGIAAEMVSGTTPIEQRRALIDRFRSGETRVVTNCMVLTEGFDEPSVDCIVVARPTRSRSLYIQMIGRGTRIYPGKQDCLIIDVVGAANRHDLVTAATLFGKDPEDLATVGLRETLVHERAAEELLETVFDGKAGELVAVEIDPFGRGRFRWIRAGSSYIIAAADGRIVVVPNKFVPDRWDVEYHRRGGLFETIGYSLPLEWAIGSAEDVIRQEGVQYLVDPDASWRKRPASEKQIAVLRKWGVPVAPNLTAGQASDIITLGRKRARALFGGTR